jgi:hypothetical protein
MYAWQESSACLQHMMCGCDGQCGVTLCFNLALVDRSDAFVLQGDQAHGSHSEVHAGAC